ncbi:MAG: fucose isomerase, partial [Anaerolineae bacterium]|nr:fucose isomerase [Anaerolineae bacterium]
MTVAQPEYVSALQITQRPVTLAVIVGNRGFFPDHLALSGRKTVLEVLEKAGIRVIITPEDATNVGAIESLEEARMCGEFFKQHRDEIDGVLVTLPNFGDERAVSNAIRFAGLDVPVLVHAFMDDPQVMDLANRRDSFCGKMSSCNNMHQNGIKYSLTSQHTMDPTSAEFMADLQKFAGVCRVVRGMRGARLGMLGARPEAFRTVRFSEKLLQRSGVSVETLDLSELFGRIEKLADDNADVQAKLVSIRG